MFIVLLRFTEKKDRARQLMDGHNRWLQQGFDDGVFLLAGSLETHVGGAVLAHSTTRSELDARVSADPFVAEQVVTAEILELQASKSGEQMRFLLGSDR